MGVFGILGVQVFGAMKSEGFNSSDSDSARAAVVLTEDFGIRNPSVILAIETPSGIDTDAAAATALLDAVASLNGVESNPTPWPSACSAPGGSSPRQRS